MEPNNNEEWAALVRVQTKRIDDLETALKAEQATVGGLLLVQAGLVEALNLVRDYIVTMKGKGHEYQIVIDAALAAAKEPA